MQKLAALTFVAIGLVLGAWRPVAAQSVAAVPTLDLNRFTGTWYEIARLPSKAEKRCVSNAIVLYALADKPRRFQVVNSCQTKDGSKNVRNGNGKEADKSGDGKLKVTYTWPFSTKLWVLALGAEDDWALVGSPNHKSLWFLCRSPQPDAGVLGQLQQKAAAEGFNVSRLIMVPQDR